jgi:hypothetical protein
LTHKFELTDNFGTLRAKTNITHHARNIITPTKFRQTTHQAETTTVSKDQYIH